MGHPQPVSQLAKDETRRSEELATLLIAKLVRSLSEGKPIETVDLRLAFELRTRIQNIDRELNY